MTVLSHLESRASAAVLSRSENSSIETSIATLQRRLSAHFSDDLSTHFRFGSSTRGTILPRSMDSRSDIDYMAVFDDGNSKPQTYMSRLKRFAEKHYQSSEIAQSHPTVVLKLNHIQFDLVPAIRGFLEEYCIPAPASSFMEWVGTSPNDFNDAMVSANKDSNYKLKPAIRLLKYWNALSGYVYDSYVLEKWAAGRMFLFCTTLRDYFFDCVEGLDIGWNEAQWRKDRVERAKRIVAATKEFERNDLPASAEQEIKKLIP